MKLAEINEMEGPQDYKLFVDLDGVLVDWAKGIEDLTGAPYGSMPKNQMWKAIGAAVKAGKRVWYDLDPTPDAFELWNYVKGYDPVILTAYATSVKSSAQDKVDWVRKHLGPKVETITVPGWMHKAEYVAPNHILIDDDQHGSKPVVESWIRSGGIGIVHTSAADTIKQLKELGL